MMVDDGGKVMTKYIKYKIRHSSNDIFITSQDDCVVVCVEVWMVDVKSFPRFVFGYFLIFH